MSREYYVYLLTNKRNTVIYVGVTNNLVRRVYQHKQAKGKGFTARYGVKRLVHFEMFGDVRDAVGREKQLKAGPRRKKLELVNSHNSAWRDLYFDLI